MTKKDPFFLFGVLLSLLIVFFPLFTLDQSFLSGDHREQQYPWAKFYQNEIRQFRLPWWTQQIQCGFPILAEGQIGAFYPLNTLFLFALPLKIAYNYEILFHYLLGAFLFYFLLRRKKLSEWAAFTATLIYLYGSTQGGYFYYNLISQRTVIWLPLTLILLDKLAETRVFKYAFFLAAVFALQVFGGYLQVAIYSIFYSTLYFLYLWMKDRNLKFLSLFSLAALMSIAFSAVQLLPTLELSLYSVRATAGKALAYVGSMKPAGFLTLWYPAWDGFLGSECYVGLAGLFLVILSLYYIKEQGTHFFVFAFFFFILLALGKFSPIYRLFVEATGFGGFRTPIKFLFFATFSACVLAAHGFEALFSRLGSDANRKAGLIFSGLGLAVLAVPPAGSQLMRNFREPLLSKFQTYVETHIYGTPGHPHGLEFYTQKAQGFYDAVAQMISPDDFFTLAALCWIAGSIVLVFLLVKGVLPKWALVLFLFTDLVFYGFTSIRPNFEPYRSIDQPEEISPLVKIVREDRSLFRTMEVFREGEESRRYPLFPNFNMLYSVDDIGIYTPLAFRAYKEFLAGTGYVNDSIEASVVKPQHFLSNLGMLSALNVKYIYSLTPLNYPYLTHVASDAGVNLYRNEKVLPRFFFVPRAEAITDFSRIENPRAVRVTKYSQQSVELEYEATEDGILFLNTVLYPRWEAKLNGKPAEIVPAAGMFQSVRLGKGSHVISLAYRPEAYQKIGSGALILLFAVAGGVTLHEFQRPKRWRQVA